MKISYEQNNYETNIPEHIIDLYKIYGYSKTSYKDYLKSKKIFESKISNFEIKQEPQNLLERTKTEILKQPKDKISSHIVKALESNNIEIQRIGASLASNAPLDQIEKLNKLVVEKITEGLNSHDIQIQRIAINMVRFAPDGEKSQLREIVSNKIKEVFSLNDVNKWRIMAKKIYETPKEDQNYLQEVVYQKANEMLDSDKIRTQRLAATIIQYAPKDKQDELINKVKVKFGLAKQQGKFNEIVESSLYNKQGSDKSNFSRDSFSKTGSETTLLLGESFKNNIIIKHMEESCFSIWKHAYENYDSWTSSGFDYIPLEPIYSFNFNSKNGLIDVSTGVLDINLEEWYAFSGNTFKDDLDKQKNKIIEVLSRLNINHGHANDANFCLRFERDKNGNVDINKIPRIFLIDFDKVTRNKST